MYFNVSNLRNIVFDSLRGVPLIGSLIPDAEEPGPYDNVSSGELITNIETLQRRNTSLTNERTTQQQMIAEYEQRIAVLEEYEANQEQFRIEQENFLNGILAEDLPRYFEMYVEMYPDEAEALAREAAGVVENEQEVRDYITMIAEMDEGSAAEAMDTLMDTNSTLVRDIMNGLSAERAAAIIDEMDPIKRAALINLMDPGF
jgi:flagellar motility protein MotE (MotC chaperone)